MRPEGLEHASLLPVQQMSAYPLTAAAPAQANPDACRSDAILFSTTSFGEGERGNQEGKSVFARLKFLNYVTCSHDQGAFCFGNEARDDLTGWWQILIRSVPSPAKRTAVSTSPRSAAAG